MRQAYIVGECQPPVDDGFESSWLSAMRFMEGMGACMYSAQGLNSAPGMALSLATRLLLHGRACFEICQFRAITDKSKP